MAKVSCGVGHSAAVTRNGALLLWGCNLYGQCASVGDIVDVPTQFGRSVQPRLHLVLFVASPCAYLNNPLAVTAHARMLAAVRGAPPFCSKKDSNLQLQCRGMVRGSP